MGSVVSMVAVRILSHPDSTIGLIPLLSGISMTLTALAFVCWYGFRRVRESEGLAPGRLAHHYAGPALSWASSSEPARKLVKHDALGLGSDIHWLKMRSGVPSSLEPHSYSSEPLVALELAAKVFSSNLPAGGTKSARREKPATHARPEEKIAALRNMTPVPQPRAAAPSAPRLRTAVLRAADPQPRVGVTMQASANSAPAEKSVAAPPREASAPEITRVAVQASSKPMPVSSPALEGKVTDYSFADFLSISPETDAVSLLPKTSARS